MREAGTSNAYLEEAIAEQNEVEAILRERKRGLSLVADSPGRARPDVGGLGRAGVRVTGTWPFLTVVVPPNMYVVHTRSGRPEPLHIGLGLSFRLDPWRDSFLVVPAAMQTIPVSARTITRERQGVRVQAYVQWIIDEIAVAYRRLDFSDPDDPMRIVNLQLRQQAEAAIKDKVATMTIDDVLTDKRPIIEELTARLREVAEGGRDGAGLGLRIVTVQIQEAIVASARLWENLQAPYRADRDRVARLAEIAARAEVEARTTEAAREAEARKIDTEREIARLRAEKEREAYDRDRAEAARRVAVEEEAARAALQERHETARAEREAAHALALREIEIERSRIAAEVEAAEDRRRLDAAEDARARARAAAEIEIDRLRLEAKAAAEAREIALAADRRRVENDLSEAHLRSRLVDRLPEIAREMPAPVEARNVTVTTDPTGGPAAALLGYVTAALGLLDGGGRAAPSGRP